MIRLVGQVKGPTNFILIARATGWSLDTYNHEVVATKSPGLRYSATLGDGVVPRLPKGVAPTPTGLRRGTRSRSPTNPAAVGEDAMAGRNPFRVGPNEFGSLGTTPSPRVAEYRNPGLWVATPSGLLRGLNIHTPSSDKLRFAGLLASVLTLIY
jgi:hypothetical protein